MQWARFHWWEIPVCSYLSISPNASYLNLSLLRKTRRVSVMVLLWMLWFLPFSKSFLSLLLLWRFSYFHWPLSVALRVISRGVLATFSGQHFVLFLALDTPISTVYSYLLHCFLLKRIQGNFKRRICGTWTPPERGYSCLRKETLVCRTPAPGAAVVWRFAERDMHGCEKRAGLTAMRPNCAALQKSIDLFCF